MLIASLHYILHWPTKGGYNFVSGPLADITPEERESAWDASCT